MQFLMLMIPEVYQPGKGRDPEHKPKIEEMEAMGKFNEEMAKEIKILSLNGLHPPQKGVRVSFATGKPVVTDGPMIETKEVLGGYWHLEADSQEQVLKWAKKCPALPGDTLEIRQIFEFDDFEMKK
jgi:hypothetical protein